MKRTLLTTLVATILLVAGARSARATDVGYSRKLGLGFMLGDPTGITGKYWVSPTNAIDFGIGFTTYGLGYGQECFTDNNGNVHCNGYYDTSINVDYLWQSKLVRNPTIQLDFYVGVGGRIFFLGDRNFKYGVDLAARAPIGLALMFTNPSFLELYFEVTPSIYLLPLGFAPEGGIGARIYF